MMMKSMKYFGPYCIYWKYNKGYQNKSIPCILLEKNSVYEQHKIVLTFHRAGDGSWDWSFMINSQTDSW